MTFRPASREHAPLRMALSGPAGSGKTYTALMLACELSDKVAAIDTEHGSVDLYADIFGVDVAPLDAPFHPDRYVKLLFEAHEAGYGCVVIDSLSHAWNGPGGIQQIVDDEVARSKSGNSFQAWAKATPIQNRMVQKLLSFPGHLIVTMRSKTAWVQEPNQNGKLVPRKIGLAPIQREGIDYEVSVAAEMDQEHRLIVTKSRYVDLADLVIDRPDRHFAAAVKAALAGETKDSAREAGSGPVVSGNGEGVADAPAAPSPDAEKLPV